MNEEITSEEVVVQFTRAIRLFLLWEEQRIRKFICQPITQVKENDSARLFRIPEAALLLKISKSQLYRMVRQAEIPCVKIGKAVRIRASDLKEMLE